MTVRKIVQITIIINQMQVKMENGLKCKSHTGNAG